MRAFKKVEDLWVVSKTTHLFGLTLTDSGKITAPEGKQVTLVYNGENVPILPGQYEGDVVLEVTDTLKYQDLDFRAAVVLENGRYAPEKSVSAAAIGGDITDSTVSGVRISSAEEAVNGIFVSIPEGGTAVIDQAQLNMRGNGGSDFAGWGAAIAGCGKGKLVISNSEIITHGAARCAVYAGESVELAVNDSTIVTRGGILPQDYEDTIKTTPPGVMRRVPWQLGLRGNCRATNLLDYANATYNRCRLSADGWGVLSTDGVKKCRLLVKDSTVEMTGEGYGALSIGDCVVTMDNTAITSPAYGMVLLMGDGSAKLTNGTTVDAGRFVTMCDMNTGLLEIDGCSLTSEYSAFVVKGSSTEFRISNTEIRPGNGVILQAMVTDDPVMPTGYYIDAEDEDVYEEGRNLYIAEPRKDIVACFSDMNLTGDIYNGTSTISGDTGMPAMGGAPGGGMPPMPEGMPPMPEGMPPMPEGMPPMPEGMPPMPEGMPPMPEGMPPMPEDMPPMPEGTPDGAPPEGGFFSSTPIKNLGITLHNVRYSGVITASVARHRVPKVTKENCEELGMVSNRPAPVVNNGVIAVLEAGSVWTVTGDCYLSALTVSEDSEIRGADGMSVKLLVDGSPVPVAPGSYTGDLRLSVG